MSDVLNTTDVTALAVIVDVAQRCAKVRYAYGSLLVSGTARSIGDQRGMFLRRDEDVRDGYLRVTTTAGFEAFLPVRDVMRMVHQGEFAVES